MWQKVQPDEHCANKCSEELAADKRTDVAQCQFAEHQAGERPDWINEARTAEMPRREYACKDCQPPASRNDDPAAVLGLRPVEQHAGDDAVAQQNENHRAEQLTLKSVQDRHLTRVNMRNGLGVVPS